MPTAKRRNWNRQDSLLAFRLYCRTPFGQLHQSNPEIVRLAERVGRTPSAVGMKACNFASLDPAQRARGIKALPNTSKIDEEIWAEFQTNPESIAAEAEAVFDLDTPTPNSAPPQPDALRMPEGATENTRAVRVRRVQVFFRSAVLSSYEYRCAITGLDVPELLNASHIIPWSVSVERRADPRNGLCLNALLDRAFDRGLISLDADLRVLVSPRLLNSSAAHEVLELGDLAGHRLKLPERFDPDPTAIAFHRQNIFRQTAEVRV